MAETSDRCLGMGQPIPRRDFLNGMAVAIGAGFGLGCWRGGEDQAPEKAAGYYPPALTGLRGSTDAAYEHAHAVRDSSFWKRAGAPIPTGETYDLAVVGAGISGLTAAYAFRKLPVDTKPKSLHPSHYQFAGRGSPDLRTGWHSPREPPHYSPPRPKQRVGRACRRPASSTWFSLVLLVDQRGGA